MVGFVLLLAWVAAVAVAETVDGWAGIDPDRRFGRRGRMLVGALNGFGIAGMSATFGGWPSIAALAGAAAGGLAIAAAAAFLHQEEEVDAP